MAPKVKREALTAAMQKLMRDEVATIIAQQNEEEEQEEEEHEERNRKKHKKRKTKKVKREANSTTSDSSETSDSSVSSKATLKAKKKKKKARKEDEDDVDNISGEEATWVPANWKDKSAMLQSFSVAEGRILLTQRTNSHLVAKLDFLRGCIACAADDPKEGISRLKNLVGRRVITMICKAENVPSGKQIEAYLGVHMTKKVSTWGKARKRVKLKYPVTNSSLGNGHRGRGGGFRGRGRFRGRGG